MIRDFQYYLENNFVKKQSSNPEEAESLMNKALSRIEYIKTQKITRQTASFIFEDIYEAFREGTQALMALKGYKPFSHEALIAFLKEFYDFSEFDLSSFDRYRILRNKTVYAAEIISEETCKASLKFLEGFLPKLTSREREIPHALAVGWKRTYHIHIGFLSRLKVLLIGNVRCRTFA